MNLKLLEKEKEVSMLFNLLQQFPNDSGPIYQETIEGRLPVEPFNTFSNLIFILILWYFGLKVYRSAKKHPFFLFAIPTIFISWIGGTVYHGTRSHEFWLVLDWLPIMIVSLGAIVYFVGKIEPILWRRGLLLLLLIGLLVLPRFLPLPSTFRISIGYTITALTLAGPFLVYSYKTKWNNVELIILGILFFVIAITFRTLDNLVVKGDLEPLLPMGTHWLWHTFGGVAVFFLLNYIFKDKEELV